MGKGRKDYKPSKNVFKVAGSKEFKAKNKAKTVVTQLKKLNEVNRQKTADVDQQLNELQVQVRRQVDKKDERKNSTPTRLIKKNVEEFAENQQKSAEALEKLNDMSMR